MEQTELTDTDHEDEFEQGDGCGLVKLMRGKKYQRMESVDELPVLNNEVNQCRSEVDNEVVTPQFVLFKKLDAVPR